MFILNLEHYWISSIGLVLEQTGKYAPLRLHKQDGEWKLKEKEGEEGLPKYCYYSGKEDEEGNSENYSTVCGMIINCSLETSNENG